MTNSSRSSQTGNPKTPPLGGHFPVWVFIVVILGAFLLLVGAVISKVDPTLLTNGGVITEPARVYADYTFARNLPLAVMLLLLLVVRARRMLVGLMVLLALIQLVDGVNDLVRGAVLLVPGVFVFALVFLLGARRLFGQEFWRVTTWREEDHEDRVTL